MSIFGVLDLLERLKGRFWEYLSFFRLSGVMVSGNIGVFCEQPWRLVLRA
ncbi:MAG: hypothetical protein AB8H12_08990 [Lewinella sp.]